MGEDVVTSPGTRVLVHGLYRCTDLNGKIGIVLDAGEGAERGRYLLRIEGTEKIVSINGWNFTIVQSKPKVVTIGIGDDGPAFDPSKLLRGDCVMCLGERQATRALVPCGHLVACCNCAPYIMKVRRCPVCRHFVSDLLMVFVPGGTRDAELKKAIGRCKAAEKRVAELQERLAKKDAIERAEAEKKDADFWDSLFREEDGDGAKVHEKTETKAKKKKNKHKEQRTTDAKRAKRTK